MSRLPFNNSNLERARGLGGWSNDALMRELSRRTNITTDDEHRIIQSANGLRIEHTSVTPNPISVTYTDAVVDPETPGFWTIKVRGLRFATYDSANLETTVNSANVLADRTFKIINNLDVDTPSIYISLGWSLPDFGLDLTPSAFSTWAPYFLYWSVDWLSNPEVVIAATDDDADGSENPTSDFEVNFDGQFQQVSRIYLQSSGDYTIEGNVNKPAHINLSSVNLGDKTYCYYNKTLSQLTVFNLIVEDTESLPSAVSHTVGIPASSDGTVYFGLTTDPADLDSPVLYLEGSKTSNEPSPMQIAYIKTDADGVLETLHPFTQRNHYRSSAAPSSLTVMAKVQAKISQHKYYLDIYGDGLYDDAGATQAATLTDEDGFINQISTDTIPVDTVVMAIKVDNHYEFQLPVWL